ncbi:MAG TPA: fuconate dehydratase [Planctomycetes bacterium]|nr:fuconate dehydratase [Planctomycetota bacterium]
MEAPITIDSLEVTDIRFPTSESGDGSDAMHTDPDYSAAYLVLGTSVPGLKGHGLAFTLGRGTEVVVQAVRALEPLIVGRSLAEIRGDWASFWRGLTSEPQLRWIGPEKGAIHLATAAVVNAIWDLTARAEGKPLWKLVADMTPSELVDCVDFRYIEDFLSREEAFEILQKGKSSQPEREKEIRSKGYPAYITSVGWLGYDDAKIKRLCKQGLEEGWDWFKMKVGSNLDDDRRRAAVIRQVIGPERQLMMDANQKWSVPEAMAWMEGLAEFQPLWIEEPTSPDDVLGHAAIARAVSPIGVATGEQCANRVVFKQLLQAEAIAFCQIDSCRLGGLNEVLAVMLMAAKAGVPVCPHAGGVGLCEHVSHLLAIDFLCVSGSMTGRVGEWVDHLHEHFQNPAKVENGRYLLPDAPGYGVAMKSESIEAFSWPNGEVWRGRAQA